jgi:hypothetical protein
MTDTAQKAQKAYEARAKAEAAEYATWRAKVPIWHEGFIAYRPGHPVPVSNVEKYHYDEQGLVERVSGDAKVQAQQAVPATNATQEPSDK